MRQIVGIRFSAFGQVETCVFEPQESEVPLTLAEGVISLDDPPRFGRVVWKSPVPGPDSETHEASFVSQSAEHTPEADIKGVGPTEAAPIPVRRATVSELQEAAYNERLCAEALDFCRARFAERGLDMKLVAVECVLDRSRIVFYFTAPSRVDFRELVKDLVRQYHTRIELRQIGVRHEAQMLGAMGNCGMVCCCRRYLREFAPVTIKMAKEQNLFLNPAKISGICGRLLCCLNYEQANYENFHRECPKLGKRYQTSKGCVRVLRGNMFRNSVAVQPDEGQEYEMTLEEWHTLKPHRVEPTAPPVKEKREGRESAHTVPTDNQPVPTDGKTRAG